VQRFYRDYLAGGPRRELDFMFRLSVDEQRELIAEGVQLFREFTGKSPRAYRAGCYAASETTLRVLKENGILIDSSYNLVHLKDNCGFATPALNAPTVLEGVYEFPVTAFRVSGAGYKPLEISAVAVNEIMTTIRCLQRAGCRDVTLCLHSFSLLKNRGLRHEHCRPDRLVIQRFRNLCATLALLKDEIEVLVFGDVDLASIPAPQPQVVPSLGWVRPAIRKLSQAVNRVPWI
jgi:hypothetical protein